MITVLINNSNNNNDNDNKNKKNKKLLSHNIKHAIFSFHHQFLLLYFLFLIL